MENLLFCLFLLCITYHIYTDIKEMLLYDWVNLALLVSGCVYVYFYSDVWQSLYGILVAGGSMLFLYFLSRGGMGEGDVKLSFILGLWLGPWKSIVCLALAFMSGGAVGSCLLLGRRKNADDRLPFGPFLCLGGATALFYGQELISWYLGYF